MDNAPLVFFRMCYGFLVAAECWGAILTGWVKRAFIIPQYTFHFIGLDWLQPLPGDGMYYYFIIMGLTGILMMLGLFYRYAAFTFFLMWTGVYLMQKTNYNNHYYLLVLLSAIMAIMPAHKANSLDVKFGFVQKDLRCYGVYIWFFILQVLIVYVYASINKINPDWLAARPVDRWFVGKAHYPVVGPILSQDWFPYFVAWGGIIYDGLIVFLFLDKRTRTLGFGLSIFFNLFNSIVFQIGIFPYLMIAFSAFFYSGETIRRRFLRKRSEVAHQEGSLPSYVYLGFAMYFLVQILLPLRHHLFPGDVTWTEEGHRMSWRMMLRQKSGFQKFLVEHEDGSVDKVNPSEYLTSKQMRKVAVLPDMTWQFAQILKQEYAERGETVKVFVEGKVSVNGSPFHQLIDPDVDLAGVSWNRFSHAEWITPPNEDDDKDN
ncbi:MAG: HTTM domain-containing protein [Cyclobacteriaceae bacterium]|nr:HTTM domain-containing protein [Cyclobacteriaceae bacterium HetDA_MAG_MS6]